MNFLVDAQLPRRLTHHLRDAGHDALHTLDLPKKNRTTDEEIYEISARERRALVTVDPDALLVPQISVIAAAFATFDYIELTRAALIFHA